MVSKQAVACNRLAHLLHLNEVLRVYAALSRYETTASALAFAVYCLAKNPDKLERLIKVGESA